MKRSIYIALLVVFTILFANQATAQVSGHRGGWLVVKTDLMSPLLDFGPHVGLEFVAFRKMTITLDYNMQKEFLGGNLIKKDNYEVGRYGEDAYIKSNTLSLGVRFYTNKAVPAPYGSHWDVKFGISRMNLHGLVYDRYGANPKEYVFTYGPMGAANVVLGYGYQWILFTRMTIDMGFSLQFNYMAQNVVIDVQEDYPDIDGEISAIDFTNRYGANVINGGNGFSVGLGFHLAIGLIVP